MNEKQAVPFLPFTRPTLGREEEDEILDSLRSGWLTTGPKTRRFEELARDYLGCAHTVALNSCTAALHLSLLAQDIGPGDEVITTPFTFPATANVIVLAGAKPVFVDIDPQTLSVNAELLEQLITDRTRAILPVDLAGRPCELARITGLAEAHGLAVVEDAAHSLGARVRGRKIGSVPGVRATCFSFHPVKNITTIEGGLVATDSAELAELIRILGWHGIDRDAWKRYSSDEKPHFTVVRPGFKYNMTDIQAAMGIHQLARLDGFIETRERLARRYDAGLTGLEGVTPVAGADHSAPGSPADNFTHARHLYVIALELETLRIDRDHFVRLMREAGIGTSVHFISLHLQPWYRDTFDFRPDDFPVARRMSERVVSLPIYPEMTGEDVDRVVEAVRGIVEAYRC